MDDAIHYAIQRFDEADKLHKQATKHKKEKLEQEAAQATEMRNMSLESFGETRKRKKSNDEEQEYKRKKMKSTGSDTFAYLREKACSDEKLKKEEMELRKLEASANREQQQEIMKHLTESQKQHQNTMQQFMQMQQQQTTTMMQQQQQLNVALLTVLQKFAPSGRQRKNERHKQFLFRFSCLLINPIRTVVFGESISLEGCFTPPPPVESVPYETIVNLDVINI